jgi:hypothetical protein
MMTLNEYKHIFYFVGLIGVILCFTQSFARVLNSTPGEQFSELYVLGPGHTAEGYPFNMSDGEKEFVYLDVGNHMGCSMYYGVDVKLRNESEPLPNGSVASPLSPLYNYTVFLGDGQVWENTLAFSFSNVVLNGNISCSIGRMQLNNAVVQLDKPAVWDNASKGFYYELFVELWAYNETNGGLIYNDRFVGLWLNMTSTT